MTEVRRRIKWLPVPDTDGRYEVSDQGQVRSVPRAGSTRGRLLRASPNKDTGYLAVTVSSAERGQFTLIVHTAVLRAFSGECPPGHETRHLNGVQTDNRLSNLCWGTKSENQHDRVRHGTHLQAAATHCPAKHPYDEENTGLDARGTRRCKACDRKRQQDKVRTSQKQERRGAEQHGGRVRPGSGSKPAAKGDVRTSTNAGESIATSGMLIEYKRTEGKGIRLTTVMLEKIRREALLDGRRPLLGFELGGRDYVVQPAEDWLEREERLGGGDQ